MHLMWSEGAKGLIVGTILGGLGGLGACIWLIPGTLFFPGDTMLFGAVICGALGFLIGEAFFEWLKERWYWLLG